LVDKVFFSEYGMAKVATPNAMPPNSHGISSVPLKGVSIGKRKTPSELRVSFRAHNIHCNFRLKCDKNSIHFGV
jgi:hypothetical protein